MNTLSALWKKLTGSKEYRESFVASQVKRGIPFQIRAMLKKNGWSQDDLAARSNLTQGAISRASNPDYGNLTLNTIIRIAAGFDVAFVGRFVPFSELTEWVDSLSPQKIVPKSFGEELEDTNTEAAKSSVDSASRHRMEGLGRATRRQT